MTISLKRFIHLWVAIIGSLFLVIASTSGIVLSLEPISESNRDLHYVEGDNLPISYLLKQLSSSYDEVVNVSRNKYGFIKVTAFQDGEDQTIYINPLTGEKIAKEYQKNKYFLYIYRQQSSSTNQMLSSPLILVCAKFSCPITV